MIILILFDKRIEKKKSIYSRVYCVENRLKFILKSTCHGYSAPVICRNPKTEFKYNVDKPKYFMFLEAPLKREKKKWS